MSGKILTGDGIRSAITVTFNDELGRSRRCTVDHCGGDRVLLTDTSDETVFIRDIDLSGAFTIPPPRLPEILES